MVEPHLTAIDNGNTDDPGPENGELASLVRRWVGVRRSGVVRVAPEPGTEAAEVSEGADDLDGSDGHGADGHGADGHGAVDVDDAAPALEPVLTPEPERHRARPAAVDQAPRIPVLPRRPAVENIAYATRLAVLVDARRVCEDVAAALLDRLDHRGSVAVCRAYGDWRRADLATWVEGLSRQGLHSFHQFADEDDQALVALAIDAVDIARETSVDEVVLAGDMTSMLPLVHRLHGAGVRVLVVGPGHTPHDVRAACDEFLDAEALVGGPAAPAGRHRA